MGENIVTDIVEQIVDEKPEKAKNIRKWLIRISIVLIGAAFTYGQLKMRNLNKIESIQKSIERLEVETKKNTESINNLEVSFMDELNKMKNEGYVWFEDYQQYSMSQFELIIDYGSSNKDLLKRMIDINSKGKIQEVKTNIEQSKIPVKSPDPSAFGITHVIGVNTSDTLFNARNASEDFLNKIRTRYKVIKVTPSTHRENSFNISYQNY
jgi:hypothetical protein